MRHQGGQFETVSIKQDLGLSIKSQSAHSLDKKLSRLLAWLYKSYACQGKLVGGSKNSLSSIAPGTIITGPPTFSPSPLKTGRDTTDSDVGFPNSSAATQYNNNANDF